MGRGGAGDREGGGPATGRDTRRPRAFRAGTHEVRGAARVQIGRPCSNRPPVFKSAARVQIGRPRSISAGRALRADCTIANIADYTIANVADYTIANVADYTIANVADYAIANARADDPRRPARRRLACHAAAGGVRRQRLGVRPGAPPCALLR